MHSLQTKRTVSRAGLLPPLRRHAARPGGLRLLDAIPPAAESLRANKGRSLLTILGIVIGVAAVITIVALGQSVQAYITGEIRGLGTNVLSVSPGSTQSSGIRAGAGTSSSLKEADADAIARQVPGIARLSPVVSGPAQVIADGNNWQTGVQAVRPERLQIQNWEIAQGSFFSEEDNEAARNVILLGQTVSTNLFPDGSSPIGRQVRIRNVPFVVRGVLAQKGTGPGPDQNDAVMIPFKTGQIRLFGSTSVNEISIQVADADQMAETSAEITAMLRARHRLGPDQADDFTIRSFNDLLSTITNVTGTLTLFLSGIAGISLLVGGIGIMNIMLVSVTERTREIGIRMAVGARASDILAQFLSEAMVLSLFGGVVGVVLGVAVAAAVQSFVGWEILIPIRAVVIAVGFSASIGIFFGIYPAHRASRLDPIEALRHQ
jgi:putative ABC transport system permease protein